MRLTAIVYRLPQALSPDARAATACKALRRRVRDGRGGVNLETVRNAVRKLGDGAGNPKCVLIKRGLGRRMPEPGDN